MTEKDIIHKLTYLLHGHRRKIFIIFGCLLISTGLNLCIPFISKKLWMRDLLAAIKIFCYIW